MSDLEIAKEEDEITREGNWRAVRRQKENDPGNNINIERQ
jgi:hypothetical protein